MNYCSTQHNFPRALLLAFSLAVLTACSGGGGGGGATSIFVPPVVITPPASTTPTYTAGVFETSTTFKQQCETPRTGLDRDGEAYPDIQGSTTRENFWLRSWSHETYLWTNELPDVPPADYNNPTDYFATQKTSAVTDSGADKDQFHFWYETEEFQAIVNSEPIAGYGGYVVLVSPAPPREARIVFTDPDTPASEIVDGRPVWERGAQILSIDGVDLISDSSLEAVETLNAGLFPSNSGESHTFNMRYADGVEREVTLVSADVVEDPVNNIQSFDTDTGKVGYIQFNTFSPRASEREIVDAMAQLQDEGVNDLILDLRYNGGGLLAVSSQLAYMVAGEERTDGKSFETLRYNTGTSGNDPIFGEPNTPVPFYSTGLGFTVDSGTPLPSLDLGRVYVLATGRTCSASESLINSLRGIDVEVVLIGDTTCGKPYGFYATDNCGYTYFTIQFEGLNDKLEGGYSDGFQPLDSTGNGVPISGCTVPDDYSAALGNVSDPMVAAALEYRVSGQCPAGETSPAPERASKPSFQFVSGNGDTKPLLTPFLRSNRDMRQTR